MRIVSAYTGCVARVDGAGAAAHAAADSQRRPFVAGELYTPLARFVVAFVVFWLAFEHGAFAATTRSGVGVVAGWALVLGVATGLWPRARPTRAALALLAALTAFAVLQLASALWGATAQDAFAEMNRTLLYAAAFGIVALAAARHEVARWTDAVALGLSALTIVALASRFFPHLIQDGGASRGLLPDAEARLSYPVGYWNGLAVLSALAVPLLLRAASHAPTRWLRGAAVGAIPAVAAVVYLASSRTGAVVGLVGGGVFVSFAADRRRAAGALVLGAAGAAAIVALLSHQSAIVDGPLGSARAQSEGRIAALALLAAAAAVGSAFVLVEARIAAARVGRRAGIAAVAAFAVVLSVAVVAAHPVQRWENFTGTPAPSDQTNASHFASLNGNWRWQLWTAAADMFKHRPLAGQGTGTFEPWWTRHGGSAVGFVGNAHSLYVQTLGELGLVGLALVAAVVLGGIGVAAIRTLRSSGPERAAAAAVLAAFTGFSVSLALDWMWELPAVPILAFALLGLVVAPAAETARRGARVALASRARIAAVVGALAVTATQADLLLASHSLAASEDAAAAGRLDTADAAANRARSLEPWAAEPYLQLALVAEQRDRIREARRRVGQAIERDRSDYRLWLVAARLDRRAGRFAAARKAHHEAFKLAPRSEVVGKDPVAKVAER
jgi:O-Antigen ligase